MNQYFDVINKNKYLTLVLTNQSKEVRKNCGELWSKIRKLIRLITKNLDDDSDDDLSLNKTVEIYNVATAVRAIFYENNKNYPKVFLDECLYEILPI